MTSLFYGTARSSTLLSSISVEGLVFYEFRKKFESMMFLEQIIIMQQ